MKTFKYYLIFFPLLFFTLFTAQAQRLTNALKAIDKEQYQVAQNTLTQLVSSAPEADSYYFYLGWVDLLSNEPASATVTFKKGLAANANSALNLIGLGAAAKMNGDTISSIKYFKDGLDKAGKEKEPYLYAAKAVLLEPGNSEAALQILAKAPKSLRKDAEFHMVRGQAYHMMRDNSKAVACFQEAKSIDEKNPAIDVAIGTIWKEAFSFEAAEQKYRDALTLDSTFGPAYLAQAENGLIWARKVPASASQKIHEAVSNYERYLKLTDHSTASLLRYADFLLLSGNYKKLENMAKELAKDPNANLRVYRYLGYSGYENEHYASALEALKKFITEAKAERVIARDYLYLGRLEVKAGRDSTAIEYLSKAAKLDSNFASAYAEIGAIHYRNKEYIDAGNAYHCYIAESSQAKLNDYFREGMSYYYGYDPTAENADSLILKKAATAFEFVKQQTASKPVAIVFLYLARVKDMQEPDRENLQGFAKPYYEKFIELKSNADDDKTKKNLSEAYSYLGAYYHHVANDIDTASKNFEKAYALNPYNKQASAYLKQIEALAENKR